MQAFEPPTRTDGFDPELAKLALKPFASGGADLNDVELARYRRFYNIEFEHSWPDLLIRMGHVDCLGYRIALHHYQRANPNKGTVFVVHGYYDHHGIFDKIIRALLASGFGVVGFDLPGHGLSSGAIAAIPDFHRYQIVLRRVLDSVADAPKPWSIVGQSTGGAIITDFLLTHRNNHALNPFNKAVLIAPLVRPWEFKRIRHLHRFVAPFASYIKRGFAINSHDQRFLDFLKNEDPLQSKVLSVQWLGALKNWVPYIEAQRPLDFPVLIIQGDDDGTVDFKHNLVVLKNKFPMREVTLLAGGKHQLVNESEAIRGDVFNAMLRFLG